MSYRPAGDNVFEQNDLIYVVGTRAQITDFFTWVCPDIKPFERVVIAGGGDLGLMLAQQIEHEFDSVLLEWKEKRALRCSAELERTLVLQADALSESAMEEAGIHTRTAYIALTDDENNIMNCLPAQKMGAAYTITQIKNRFCSGSRAALFGEPCC